MYTTCWLPALKWYLSRSEKPGVQAQLKSDDTAFFFKKRNFLSFCFAFALFWLRACDGEGRGVRDQTPIIPWCSARECSQVVRPLQSRLNNKLHWGFIIKPSRTETVFVALHKNVNMSFSEFEKRETSLGEVPSPARRESSSEVVKEPCLGRLRIRRCRLSTPLNVAPHSARLKRSDKHCVTRAWLRNNKRERKGGSCPAPNRRHS